MHLVQPICNTCTMYAQDVQSHACCADQDTNNTSTSYPCQEYIEVHVHVCMYTHICIYTYKYYNVHTYYIEVFICMHECVYMYVPHVLWADLEVSMVLSCVPEVHCAFGCEAERNCSKQYTLLPE